MDLDMIFYNRMYNDYRGELIIPYIKDNGVLDWKKSGLIPFAIFDEKAYMLRSEGEFEQYSKKLKVSDNFYLINKKIVESEEYIKLFQKMYGLCKEYMGYKHNEYFSRLTNIINEIDDEVEGVNSESKLLFTAKAQLKRYIDYALVNFIYNLNKLYYLDIFDYDSKNQNRNLVNWKDVIYLANKILGEDIEVYTQWLRQYHNIKAPIQQVLSDVKNTTTDHKDMSDVIKIVK